MIHSKYGASVRARNAGCPGSPRLCSGIPSVSSPAADWGTEAHGYSDGMIRHLLPDSNVDGFAPPKDPEMREVVAFYVNYLIPADFDPAKTLLLSEQRLALPEAHPEVFGTCDAVKYTRATQHLEVVDLKAGAGVEVEAHENKQLLQYGCSALWRLELPVSSVQLTIVQPRAPSGTKIKSWHITADRLFDETYTIRDEIAACEAPDAPLIPGSWCRFCPAAATCPALRDENFEIAKMEFAPVASQGFSVDEHDPAAEPRDYDPKELARCLAAVPRMKAWCESVDKFAYAEAQHGRTPPGYKLVAKREGPRKWVDEQLAEQEMCDKIHGDSARFYTDPKLKSPTQLEKILTEEDYAILAPLVVRESTGVALVAESDPRPAVNTRPEDEFTIVNNTLPDGG